MRLVSTILIALLAAAWLPFGWASVTAPERIPPCHQHGKPSPAPGPVSHQCCQSGHNSPMVKPQHQGTHFTSTTSICNRPETLAATFCCQLSPTALHHNSDPIFSLLRV